MEGLPGEQREKHKARCRAYYLSHKEQHLARQKQRRIDLPEERKAHDAKYRVTHSEQIRVSKEQYRLANLGKVKLAKQRWRESNPEKMQAAREVWERNNPERKQIHRENRRARERQAIGKISSDLTQRLYRVQRGRCAICSEKLGHYELDHIMPLVLGGTNEDSNIQLLCKTCNRVKGKKHPLEFLRSKGLLL